MLDRFYDDVLPAEGWFALWRKGSGNLWCGSRDELLARTEELSDRPDLYFSTCSFHEEGDAHEGRGGTNCALRRTICIDIDAGPRKFAKHGDKVYRTKKDALAALTEWLASVELLPGYLIDSGDGLHVYFLLDRDYEPGEWRAVATAIKLAALGAGLKIDPTVTADFARILRPVGSLHSASGRQVKVLKTYDARYSLDALAERFPQAQRDRAERKRSLNDDFLEAAYVGPPRSVKKIIEHCGAMRHVARTRGDVPEPTWRAMLGVVKFTVEGLDAAHALSQGHPEYDPGATEEKFNRWTAGPTTCDLFAAEVPEACAKCKYRGQVKSPILLGGMTVEMIEQDPKAQEAVEQAKELALEATQLDASGKFDNINPWDGHLPDGFAVSSNLSMWQQRTVMKPDATGAVVPQQVPVVFCRVPFWITQWAEAAHSGDEAQADVVVYNPATHEPKTYRLPTRVVAKRDTLLTFLASLNVNVPSDNTAKLAMEDYVKESLERIRIAGLRPKITSRLGLDYDRTGRLFIAHGERLIQSDGYIHSAIVGDKLMRSAMGYHIDLPQHGGASWTPDVWQDFVLPRAKRHADFMNKYYAAPFQAPYRLAIMLSWASPMLAFTEGSYVPKSALPGVGLAVSLYSQGSGRGKTSAQRNAALAFGDPSKLVRGRDDRAATENARTEEIAAAGTLPVFMDEMGEVRPAATASLISMIGNGATRERMTKELSTVGGDTVSLVVLMSTNKSQRELVAADRTDSNAVQLRMLEINCNDMPDVVQDDSSYETDKAALQDCRGAIGAVIHWTMAQLGTAGLNKLGLECAIKAREMIGGVQDGRILWRALGAMLAVRRMLKLHGLQIFDTNELVAEFKKWHDAGYAFAAENVMPTDAQSLVSLMLNELAPRTLVTNGMGEDKLEMPLNDRIPDQIVARSVLHGRYCYVSTVAIQEWAFKRRTSPQGILQKCREAGLLIPVAADGNNTTHRVDLARGTRVGQGVRISCVMIDLNKLAGGSEAALPDNVVALRRRSGVSVPDQMPSSSASS